MKMNEEQSKISKSTSTLVGEQTEENKVIQGDKKPPKIKWI